MAKYIDADRLRKELSEFLNPNEEWKHLSKEELSFMERCKKYILATIDHLQHEQPEEEMSDKTLDEAAWKYAEKEAAKKVDKKEFNDYLLHHIFDGEALYTGFKEGAKWQKEQMMKEVVEANVIATKCGDKYQQLLIADWNNFNDLLNDDKVRIVVLKKEENK